MFERVFDLLTNDEVLVALILWDILLHGVELVNKNRVLVLLKRIHSQDHYRLMKTAYFVWKIVSQNFRDFVQFVLIACHEVDGRLIGHCSRLPVAEFELKLKIGCNSRNLLVFQIEISFTALHSSCIKLAVRSLLRGGVTGPCACELCELTNKTLNIFYEIPGLR